MDEAVFENFLKVMGSHKFRDFNAPFIPSREWQVVPENVVMPPGCEHRINEVTTLPEARWDDPPPPEAVIDNRPESPNYNPSPFVPSNEWQVVPDGVLEPSGGEYRTNTETREREVRWDDPPPGPETVIDNRKENRQKKIPNDDVEPPGSDEQVLRIENEPPPCPYAAVNWDELRAEVPLHSAGYFTQEAIFPADSILTPYMEEARTCCEAADIYLLDGILTVCARLLARRVYADWGMEKLYPNIFELMIGTAGMRKTSAIRCARRVAWNCLPPEAFLSAKQSVEALFEEYCIEEGGCPDKLMLVEEGNSLMATWAKSEYGARVAAEFLQLYDCAELTENFMRNKSKDSGSKRIVPETSTSVVIGGTFGVATFPLEQVKEGIARRFMYGVAEKLGRTIYWPERLPSFKIADLFKPLLKIAGEIQMPRQGAVWDRWVAYQDQNRQLINEASSDNEVLAARLTSAPTQVLKVAMTYEACRALFVGSMILGKFTLPVLDKAIGFVEEHLRAAAFLDQYGKRKAIQEHAEVVLATVRRDFEPQRDDTIYATRTELTRQFCRNTGRHGAMTVDDLYLRILPELARQGEVTRVVKRNKFEVYGFRTEFEA